MLKSIKESKTLSLLLDSSLITQTNRVEYDMKIVDCGDYVQVYKFRRKKIKDKDLEEIGKYEDRLKKKKLDELNLFKIENLPRKSELKFVAYKNLLRSRFSVERLIKANKDVFKTFITLTFEENVKDIVKANKTFNIWKTYIKRLKPDFKYVCVPEYQKRGAVHYHLLTNIEYQDFSLLSKDIRKIYNKKSGWQIGRDVKGWKYGHNMAKDLTYEESIITYLSKYMTKEADNRLFGHRKYLNSLNLKKPHESYLDITKIKHVEYLNKILKDMEIDYGKNYVDYYGDEVIYMEYKKQKST